MNIEIFDNLEKYLEEHPDEYEMLKAQLNWKNTWANAIAEHSKESLSVMLKFGICGVEYLHYIKEEKRYEKRYVIASSNLFFMDMFRASSRIFSKANKMKIKPYSKYIDPGKNFFKVKTYDFLHDTYVDIDTHSWNIVNGISLLNLEDNFMLIVQILRNLCGIR